ncbi:type IV pilus twitching motility protein PilT [Tessaracoccus sp.]
MLEDVLPYLQTVVESGASDLHIKAGSPPKVRITGQLRPLKSAILTPEDTERLVRSTMTKDVEDTFNRGNEADYAISVPGIGRFRVNAFRGRGSAGMVLRLVPSQPRTLAELNLPDIVGKLALEPRGLVLVTGPTGSGKSTTLAAMVDRINETEPVHILAIEDPIEVLHTDKIASVNQRELRTDTADFKSALRAAMRQDPDVILIGEMRDRETVAAGLTAAETGHFVMSTLHTTDATETINRVVDFFPPFEQKQIRLALSQSLKGIICQRLVQNVHGGRSAVMEIAISTMRLQEAIMDPQKTVIIPDIIAEGRYHQMQTFDQHLVQLVQQGDVAPAEAMRASTHPHELTLLLKRVGIEPT